MRKTRTPESLQLNPRESETSRKQYLHLVVLTHHVKGRGRGWQEVTRQFSFRPIEIPSAKDDETRWTTSTAPQRHLLS